ncbi:DMT family transporter [Candidatus Parcubacteria bacterium]|nr:MAG: DMT family transporter [Candidatus Parcubacteria bacterium]
MNQYKTGPWLIFLAALLWAVDAPFRKFLTAGLPSATIVLMEHIVIAVLVIIFLAPRLKELNRLSAFEWFSVFFIGFGGSALATVFFTQSFHYVNPSVAILLQKIQPIIAIFLAMLILKEKLMDRFWLWAAVAILGTYLVTLPDIRMSGLSLAGGTKGVAFALLAALLWGSSTVFGRVVLKKISFQAMTAIRFLTALVFLLFLNVYDNAIYTIGTASPRDWAYVFIIAILAGFVSLLIYYKGLRVTSASVATLGELAFPFAAVVVNWKFLGATLFPIQILGGLVLLFAVWKLSSVNAEMAAH